MRLMRNINQRGDTLVEVTIALAIMSFVLTGAFAAANQAFRLGQQAKERSQMVGYAQQQAEALESFRDSHPWSVFVNGNGAVNGITSLDPTCSCFNMKVMNVNGLDQWVPQPGSASDSGLLGGQGYVSITIADNPSLLGNPPAYDFVITYGVPRKGGGSDLVSTLRLRLADLDGLRQ